jgi:hypothetical protein
MCLGLVREKLIEGLVPYRVPMDPSDPYFQMIRREHALFRGQPVVESPNPRDPNTTPPSDNHDREKQPGHLRTLQPSS